ncbi:MAG: DUF302 domain-containing protein [Gammaproteobacteria bacterium]
MPISGRSRLLLTKFFGPLLLASVLTACATEIPKQGDLIQYYEVTTNKPYDEALAELKIAISEHNFRITSHSRVGKVIRGRGAADFPDYDTIQFCNLSHAKTLLEISADAIRHMPCSVVLYTRNNQTVIKARLLPVDSDQPELNQFSKKINRMLREIVDFAAEI